MAVIEVENLKKYYQVHQKEAGIGGSLKSFIARKYETVKAVDNISFSLGKGELAGFIGPNGAGKTTTLKCLSGLLYPTTGKIAVLGYIPWERKQEFLRQIGFVTGMKNQLLWDLPALESFILNRDIYEIPEDKFKRTLKELTELLDVQDILNVQVRKLSLGQRMKCELIAALLHYPPVVFLDEPTIGLDIVSQKRIREFIRKYNREYESTILLTSHYLADVEQLCQRVLVINEGKLIFDGELSQVIEEYADYKFMSVVLTEEIDPAQLQSLGEVKEYVFPKLVLQIRREHILPVTNRIMQELPIRDFSMQDPPLEDIVSRLYTGREN